MRYSHVKLKYFKPLFLCIFCFFSLLPIPLLYLVSLSFIYLYFHSVHLSRFPLKSPSSKSPSTLELLYSIAQWTPRSCWIPLFQASQSRSNSVNLLVLKNINRNCSSLTSLQKNANKCKFKVEMTIFLKYLFVITVILYSYTLGCLTYIVNIDILIFSYIWYFTSLYYDP